MTTAARQGEEKSLGQVAREASNKAWQDRSLGCHGRWEYTAQAAIAADKDATEFHAL